MGLLESIMNHDKDYLHLNDGTYTPGVTTKVDYHVIKEIEQKTNGDIEITTTKGEKYIIKARTVDGYTFEIGATLKYDADGKLEVNVANEVEEDNTLPVTAAAVAVEIGNIDALLGAI